MSAACGVCAVHAAIDRGEAAACELVAWSGQRWRLRHHAHPAPLAGWMLLDATRHVQSPADFDADEAREFGAVLQAAMRAVREVAGVPRVYVTMFGEGAPHLHAHLIPRDPGTAETKAWAVADWYRMVEACPAKAATRDEIIRATKEVGLLMSRAVMPVH